MEHPPFHPTPASLTFKTKENSRVFFLKMTDNTFYVCLFVLIARYEASTSERI